MNYSGDRVTRTLLDLPGTHISSFQVQLRLWQQVHTILGFLKTCQNKNILRLFSLSRVPYAEQALGPIAQELPWLLVRLNFPAFQFCFVQWDLDDVSQ